MQGEMYNFMYYSQFIIEKREHLQSMAGKLLRLRYKEASDYTLSIVNDLELLKIKLDLIGDIWKAIDFSDQTAESCKALDDAVHLFERKLSD